MIGGLVKKLLAYTALLAGSAVAGVLVWRKVEADQHRDDLWAEAEKISSEQDSPRAETVYTTESVPAPRA